MVRHFLDLRDHNRTTLGVMLDLAAKLKAGRAIGEGGDLLKGKHLAMIFEKPSTRTRVSFDIGIKELGGNSLVLGKQDMQLGHGETVADTARVLARYADLFMLRCHGHDMLLELAEHAEKPVINGLTDYNHPCQVMADLLTLQERKSTLEGLRVAWVGDGNNVANTWIVAAQRFGIMLELACPKTLMPCADTVRWANEHGAQLRFHDSAAEAVKGVDVVITDTWVSMGQKDAARRAKLLEPYRVDAALMAEAAEDALFMHCLPAHRGEEVTDEVLDGPQSVVWDEAENRLHVQKAIMLWCMSVI